MIYDNDDDYDDDDDDDEEDDLLTGISRQAEEALRPKSWSSPSYLVMQRRWSFMRKTASCTFPSYLTAQTPL